MFSQIWLIKKKPRNKPFFSQRMQLLKHLLMDNQREH